MFLIKNMFSFIFLLFCLTNYQPLWSQKTFERKLEIPSDIFVVSFRKIPESIQFIKDNQLTIKYETSNWYFVSIPENTYEILINSNLRNLVYNEFGEPELHSDSSAVTHRIDQVQQGMAGIPFTGKNVVMGIVDTGVDYKHPDFLDSTGKTRVYRYWDQTKNSATPTSPKPYNYGELWTNKDMDSGKSKTKDDVGHGTNVSGIAAGNGSANGHNKGMAPNATIIMVETNFSAKNWTLTVADACDYIFKVADSLGLPAVINISAGIQFGSHDGTDPASEKMETLLDEKAGRIIVAAAGNSGDKGAFHVHGDVDTDTSFYWVKSASNGIAGINSIYVDMWADSIDFVDVKMSVGANLSSGSFAFRGRTPFRSWGEIKAKDPKALRDTLFGLSGKKLAYVDYYTTLINHVIRIELVLTNIDSTSYNYQFSTTGKGSYDAWSGGMNTSNSKTFNDFVTTNLPTTSTLPAIQYYHKADTLQSLYSSYIASEKVVTVGNINNRKSYKDKNGNIFTSPYNVGELGLTSSKGPNRKGVVKPDVVACGNYTFAAAPLSYLSNSANNAKIDQYGMHASNGGTSMASPVIAGIAALYLEKCSKATYQDFINDLHATAKSNKYTGTLPNYTYGYGVADALQTLLRTNNTFSLTGNTTITCSSSSTVLVSGNKPIQSILWDDNTTSVTKTFTKAKIYFFTAKDNLSCITKDSVVITNNTTLPTISITNNSNKQVIDCKTTQISLTATGGQSYIWSKGSTPLLSSNDVNTSGTIILTGTDQYGCIGKDSLYLMIDTVKPKVSIDVIGASTISCDKSPVYAQAKGANNFIWNTGQRTDTITFKTPGKYLVTGSLANGCSDTDTIQINQLEYPETPIIQVNDSILTASTSPNYQWYIDGIAQPGDTLASLKMTKNATYMVSTQSNGCIATSTYYKSTMNIVALNEKNEIIVYPNPIVDNQIHIKGLLSNPEIHIIDLQGIKRKLTLTNTIDITLPTLASGIYILEVKQENETQLFKIIKN
jgi:subtilisin family serine protease